MAWDVLFRVANLWGRLCLVWPKMTQDVLLRDVLSYFFFGTYCKNNITQ